MSAILHILQHALGRNQYGKGTDHRNHFCTGECSADFALCREAVSLGLMTEHAPRVISGGDYIFTVTDAGKAYIAEHSPPEPKVSRGKARYLRWLEISDVYPDWTFGDWLKKEARGGAQ